MMRTLLYVLMLLGSMGLLGLTIEFKTLTSVNFNATCQIPFDCCQGFHDGVTSTAIAFPVAQGHVTAGRLGKGVRPRHFVVWCGHHWLSTRSTSFWESIQLHLDILVYYLEDEVNWVAASVRGLTALTYIYIMPQLVWKAEKLYVV